MASNQVTVSTPGPAGVPGLTYEALWVVSSVYQVRDLVRFTDGNLYICNVQHTATSGNTPVLNATIWTLFINADDAFQWATKAKHSQITDSLGNTGYSALHQAAKALDWASLTTDAVTNDANSGDVDYSAKAWAIGGTEVSTTAARGASKEWATKTNAAVDTSEFSAKAYAIGGTGVTTSSGKGAAKEWATTTGGAVDTSDFSAKAWAIGGTGVTTTSAKGAAKEWAIATGLVDTASYSSKEYSQGYAASTGGSAKDYAQYTGGGVRGATSDHSAKAWAVGGTGVTTTAAKGAAKEWATTTGAAVDTSEYSAKEYAIGTTVAVGSAKDWAVQAEDSAVTGSSYSALHHAAKAAASATAGAGSATAGAASATAAAASETAANASADAVSDMYDAFHDFYLGSMSDAVTFTGSSSSGLLITSAAHGLVDTQVIRVANTGGALPGNLSASTDYYVRDKTTNNFKLATSSGGTAIAHSSDGSGSNTWFHADFATPASSSWPKDSSVITVASNVGIRVGQLVSGSGIPTSPKPNVVSIVGTAISISENMVAAGSSVAVTFANKGVYGAFDATKDGPSTNNDGEALTDGVKYFNTTDDVMLVYDETSSAWKRMQPTSTEQGHINTVSGIQANVTTVAGISGNVTTVAGISANVTTVAGISANVTTVAGISANTTTVAGISGNVTTVAGISSDVTAVAADASDIGAVAAKATEIGRLGTADAVADMVLLGTTDCVADMAILATADIVADMALLGTADCVADMALLGTADCVADMAILGTADVVTDLNTLGTADVVSDLNTLGTADVVSDMNTLGTGGNVTNMNTLAGIAANITTVAGISANVTTVAGVSANVTTVAGSIADVNRYANEYTIASSAPGSPSEGDLWYDSTNNVLKFHNGTTFATISAPTHNSMVDDTTPQLGGNLDVNGQDIVSVSDGDIDIQPNGTGDTNIKNLIAGSGATGYGIVPVGGIIAVQSGLSGAYGLPSTGAVSTEGWMVCDGASIPGSQTLSGNVPTLTDARFLQGNTHANVGGTGGDTIPAHTHTGPSHTHTGPAHTHTGPSHTHTGPSHTHTGPSHTHTGPSHTHSGNTSNTGSHTHGQRGRYIGGGGGLWGSGYTSQSGETNAAGSHSHSFSTNSGGTGATGGAGTGATGASGTGATGSEGTGATSSSGTGATGAEGTGASGSFGTGSAVLPKFLRVVYLMRVI